jgi:hypothetical protein
VKRGVKRLLVRVLIIGILLVVLLCRETLMDLGFLAYYKITSSYNIDMPVVSREGMEKDRGIVFYQLAPSSFLMLRNVNEKPEYAGLIRYWVGQADKAMLVEPLSVVDKPKTPPSGDKHDYMSLSIYWWPNSLTGKPYILRDGQRNPEYLEYDLPRLELMQRSVYNLAVAWWLTGNQAYVEKAVSFLRTWFINPETRMNPHLTYGQGIPGIKSGSWWSIIETSELALVLIDAISILEHSDVLTEDDSKALKNWFFEYVRWLQTSLYGEIDRYSANNHSVYYDLQVATFTLFVGDRDLACYVLEHVVPQRIEDQIEPDGRMPAELKRTRSYDYTIYTLEAFYALANLAEKVGIDLWNYKGSVGQSIRGALDYALTAVVDGQIWEHPQISPINPASIVPLLYKAARVWQHEPYRELAERLDTGGQWKGTALEQFDKGQEVSE